MESTISRIRRPVKRERADYYLRLMLISFAASVIVTRLFLSLTGYPQLGNQSLHIAHVLYGGLLLFIAALLPLVISNRWVYTTGAILSGLGVGLFIDEVGKFITQANDYFYPPAAPIIYAFFLLTVLVYLQVRQPPSDDARAELYRALDGLSEVLDHNLEPREQADLERRLSAVASHATHPDLAQLATVLLHFITSGKRHLAEPRPPFWQRWLDRLQSVEERWVTRRRFKTTLVAGLAFLGLLEFGNLLEGIALALSPGYAERIMDLLQSTGRPVGEPAVPWFLVRLLLEGIVGFSFVAAAYYLLRSQERLGLTVAQLGLLISLATINLLAFYFDQFRAVFDTLIQFVLLQGLIYYRRNYASLEPEGQLPRLEP